MLSMFSMDLGNLSSILSRVDMQILYNFTQNIQAASPPPPTMLTSQS